MKKILLLLVLIFSFGTAAHATATAEIQNCDVKTYKDFIVRRYMTNGFRVQVPNDNSMTASKEITNNGTKFLLKMLDGARTHDRVEVQANYNFIQNGSNILVQLTILSVSDPGTVLQKIRTIDAQQEVNELNSANADFIGNINNEKK